MCDVCEVRVVLCHYCRDFHSGVFTTVVSVAVACNLIIQIFPCWRLFWRSAARWALP